MNVLEARRRLLGADVQKKTAEGNPISVRSLARMYSRIEMQGWTEQQSTTGAQLFDCNLIPGREINGITFTNNNDGSIRISGTSTAQAYTAPIPISLPPGTYYVSDNNGKSDAWTFYVGTRTSGTDENWADKRNHAFTVTETDSVRAYVSVTSGQTLDVTIYPMLNSGSTAHPYEPYTGNQPSPSPDYPQEIINAGKYNEESQKWEYEVKLTGANLLDAKKYVELNSKYYEIGPNGGVIQTVDDGRPVGLIPVVHTLPPGTFYIRGDKSYGQVIIDGVTFNMSVPGSYVILTLEKETDIAYKFYVDGNTSYPSEEYFPMVSRVQDATYEPYRTPQTVLLQSDRPLTKWDRLEKRDGQWGWVYKSDAMEFDGSEDENWLVFKENLNNIWFYLTINGKYSHYDVFCNKFRFIERGTSSDDVEGIGNLGLNTSFSVGILKNKLISADVAGWKSWIQSNPFTIWYKTTKETFIPLTESEQAALNALHTNYPTTVLVNDQGCEMKLTYKTKKSLEVTT